MYVVLHFIVQYVDAHIMMYDNLMWVNRQCTNHIRPEMGHGQYISIVTVDKFRKRDSPQIKTVLLWQQLPFEKSQYGGCVLFDIKNIL